MSEATLQTLAYSLGIDKLVRNMTESEKAQLRYIQIMRSTSEWQTDMGRTIVTPANALRVMKQQFIQLGRAIGNVFIPIIMLVMPYIIALTQLITALAKKIAEFVSKILGIKIVQDIDYSNLGEISAGITDIGTSADKTTEKLNTMLAPFDDLNVVQTKSKSGGSGSGLGGSGGDLGVPLSEYNALANLNKTFAEGVENAKAKLKSLLPLVIAVGSAFALWKISSGFISTLSAILNTADILSKVTPMTSAKWTKILGGGLVIAIGSVLATIGLGLGWNAIKTALEENGWDNNSLQKYGISSAILVVGGFIIGAGIALATGTAVLTAGLIGVVVAGIVVALGLIISSIVMYWEEIKKFFGDLPNWFNQNVVTPIISFFTNSFGTIATWLNDTVIQPIWSFIEPVVTNIITIIKSILTTVSMIFKSIFTVISTIFGAVFEVVSTRIKNLIDIIKGIGTAVFTVVGKISEIVLKVVEIIWVLTSTLFSNIFSAISDLANWVYTSFIEPVLLKIKLFVTKLTTIMAIIVTTINDKVIQPLVKLFTNLVTKVINLFKNIGISVSNAFASVFKSVLNGVFVLIETKINGFISALNTGIKVINKIPGVSISKVSKISIPRFDDGGYPTSGELFFANENGVPEMVGKIGNQTAVANNDQITTSITNALISALNQYDFGGGKAPTTIYIGNRKVYEGYGDYMAEENDRYGTNMIKI